MLVIAKILGIDFAAALGLSVPALADSGGGTADPSFVTLFVLGAFGVVVGVLGARKRPSD